MGQASRKSRKTPPLEEIRQDIPIKKRAEILIKISKNFHIEKARSRNKSFDYFWNKIQIL
ncbi:hypothetical protein YIM1627_22820 [Thermus oshimai]